jgi:hypothetical protein
VVRERVHHTYEHVDMTQVTYIACVHVHLRDVSMCTDVCMCT